MLERSCTAKKDEAHVACQSKKITVDSMTDGLYGEVCGFDKFEISNFYLEQCLDDYFASSSYAKEIKRTNLSKI